MNNNIICSCCHVAREVGSIGWKLIDSRDRLFICMKCSLPNAETTVEVKINLSHSLIIRKRNGTVTLPKVDHDDLIVELHDRISKANPFYHVNFEWPDKSGDKNFICGIPYQMEVDEQAIVDGKLLFKDFTRKWYGLR